MVSPDNGQLTIDNGQLPIFESRFELTKPMFREWERRLGKLNPYLFRMTLVRNVIQFVALAAWLILWRVTGEWGCLYVVAVLAVVLFLDLTQGARRADSVFKSLKEDEKPWIRAFVFREDLVSISKGDSLTTFSYDQFYLIKELDDGFYLYHGTGVFIVPKDSFTVGSAGDFGEFIRGRCTDVFTEKETRRFFLKASLPVLILPAVLIAIMLFLGIRLADSPMIRGSGSSVEQLIASWEGEQQLIAIAEIDGGAAIFFVEPHRVDDIVAVLLRETNGRYSWVDGYSYSLTLFVEDNRSAWGVPEEEGGDFLTFAAGSQAVVFGVGEVPWWDALPANTRAQYTSQHFRHGSGEFVLYYRVIEN
jgi:hypothetical protein